MRELTTVETEQAGGGGIIGAVLTFIGGVFGSYVGSYAYEESGGADGINKAVSDAWNSHIENQKQICQYSGLGCSMM